MSNLDQSILGEQLLKTLLGNEKQFKMFPIDEQVTYVTNLLTLGNLYRLKLEVQDAIDPSKNFEHSVQFLFINRFFELYKKWLLETCIESKTEKAPEALSMIDYNITRITNILFDGKPQQNT